MAAQLLWPLFPPEPDRRSRRPTVTKTDTDPRPLLNAAGLWAEQCLFNRGIVLVDTAAWKAQHVTEEIEQWMVWDHFATQAFGYG